MSGAHWPARLLVLLLVTMTVACSGAGEETASPAPLLSPTAPARATRTPAHPPQIVIIEGGEEVPATPAAPRYFESPEYGIQAFLFWDPEEAERDIRLIQEMGFGWVKQGFAWRDIEPFGPEEPDWWKPDRVVEAVEEAGLKLLVRLDRQPFWAQEEEWPPLENAPPADLADFGSFCGRLAERYRGRIQAYQIWNEPNLSREWGEEVPDPAAYTELLRVCYEAIKAADPLAIVISAGLAPTGTQPPEAMPDAEFLQGMYDAGAGAYFDVLGLNAPGYKAPPELDPAIVADPAAGYGGNRWMAFRHVEEMRRIMVANGDAGKQVALLEVGWILEQEIHESYIWFGVSEAEQAAYLVGAFEYAREQWQPWIGLMTVVYIADRDWTPEANEQWWWAIVLPDGTPRKAYFALKEMEK
jgi:polysaccharide biosynthesis protein PslG